MGSEAGEDELLSMLERTAEAFLADRHSLARVRQPQCSLWQDIVDLGLPALLLPENQGGAEVGAIGAIRLAKLFGRTLLPEPFVEHALVPATFALSLPEHSEIRGRILSALTSSGETVALCQFDSPCVAADLLLASRGDAIVLVEESDGLTPLGADLLGNRVVAIAARDVAGSKVCTGETAARALARALDIGALATSALLLGAAGQMFELTLAHLKTRRQFGQPLGAFQGLQHRAVDIFMALAKAEAVIEDAARRFDSAPDAAASRAAISAAKVSACELAALTAREAVQMHGAMGFTEESDVGLFVRAVIVWAPRYGDALTHRRRFLALEGEADA